MKPIGPLMGRCARCGRFVKRGICNWVEHEANCLVKPKLHVPASTYPQHGVINVGPEMMKALDEAFEEYWNEIR